MMNELKLRRIRVCIVIAGVPETDFDEWMADLRANIYSGESEYHKEWDTELSAVSITFEDNYEKY